MINNKTVGTPPPKAKPPDPAAAAENVQYMATMLKARESEIKKLEEENKHLAGMIDWYKQRDQQLNEMVINIQKHLVYSHDWQTTQDVAEKMNAAQPPMNPLIRIICSLFGIKI